MPFTEAQSSISNKNFFQKLLEQTSFNTTSTSLIAPNLNDLFLSSFNNSLITSNQIDKILTNSNIQFLPFVNQTNNILSKNTPFDAYMYYNAYMHFQSLLSNNNNNNNSTNIQQQLTIANLSTQNQSISELKSPKSIKQGSFNSEQQNALYTLLFDATTKSNNLNTINIFKDIHSLKHRLKRQTISSQSQNSTLGNETSLSFNDTSNSSSVNIISSLNFLNDSPKTNFNQNENIQIKNRKELNMLNASSPTKNCLNTITKSNNSTNNEMLVPSNDKEGWCRNKKYIQIVKKGYRCTVCNKIYGRYNSVSYHVTIYHRNPPIRCEEDGCQFTTREARYIHFHKYYRHQIPLPESIDLVSRKCPLIRCKHVSKSPAMLEKHIQRHIVDCLRDGVYECTACHEVPSDFIFKTTSYELIYEHLRNVHSINLTTIKSEEIISNSEYLSPIDVIGTCSSPDSNGSNEDITKPDSSTSSDNTSDENVLRFNNQMQQKQTIKSLPNFPCNTCSYRGRTLSNLEQHKNIKHRNLKYKVDYKNVAKVTKKLNDEANIIQTAAKINLETDHTMNDLTNLITKNSNQQLKNTFTDCTNSFSNLNGLFNSNNYNNNILIKNNLLNLQKYNIDNQSFNTINNVLSQSNNIIMPNINLFEQQLQLVPNNHLLNAVQQLIVAQNTINLKK